MDTKTLIKESQARFDHHHAKQRLKEKYQTKLKVAHQGGLWKATPELLGYLYNLTDTIILIDEYENPVKVDPKLLYAYLNQTYTEVTTAWYNDLQEIRHNR